MGRQMYAPSETQLPQTKTIVALTLSVGSEQEHYAKLRQDEIPKWECPIVVAVTEDQLVLLEKGVPQWRKISMDVMIYAFLEEFDERISRWHVDAGLIPTNFWKAARHVPINYKFFAPAADLESQIFVASLQILEDFSITADVLAPRAFHLMKLWAQSREM